MPIVPTFKPNTNLSPMPGVRQQDSGSPAAFGAGVAQATERVGGQLAQVGGELAQLGAQIQQRQDSVAAKEAYQRASERALSLMHDPKTGLLVRQAGDARGLTNQATKELERIQTESTKGLTPAQKRMFDGFWAGTRDSSITSAARHEAAQIKVSEDLTNDAIIENAAASIGTNAYDPAAMQHFIDVGMNTLASKYRGFGKEVFDRGVAEFKTKAFSDVLARMMSDQKIDSAEQFLNAHENEIFPKMAEELRKQIGQKKTQMFAESKADEMAPFGTDPSKEGEVLAELNKQYQAHKMTFPQYQEAEKMIQARFADLARVQERTNKAEFAQGMEAIRSSGGYAQGEKIAMAAKNPEIVDNLIRFNMIIHREEYEQRERARSIANSIAAAEAGRRATDRREDIESTVLQDKYASALEAVKGDVSQVQAYIGKTYQGKEEEDLRRYAHNRAILEPEKKTQMKLSPFAAGSLAQGAMGQTMEWFDRQKRMGANPTVYETTQHLLKTAGPEAESFLTREDASFLAQYVKQSGTEGFISASDVADAINSVNMSKVPMREVLERYPDIYKAVLTRVGSQEKALPADKLKPIVAQLMTEYDKTAPMLWGKGTALQSVVSTQRSIDVVTEAFGDRLTSEQQNFLDLFVRSGKDLSQETPRSLQNGMVEFLKKKSADGKKKSSPVSSTPVKPMNIFEKKGR